MTHRNYLLFGLWLNIITPFIVWSYGIFYSEFISCPNWKIERVVFHSDESIKTHLLLINFCDPKKKWNEQIGTCCNVYINHQFAHFIEVEHWISFQLWTIYVCGINVQKSITYRVSFDDQHVKLPLKIDESEHK